MSSKPKRSRSKRKKKKTGRRKAAATHRNGWKWLSALILLTLLVVGGYLLYLSHTVRVQFEGKRWAVPARIYAQPLELYEGKAIGLEQLRAAMADLGYRKVGKPYQAAQWSERGGRLRIYTRAFVFWDGEEPARRIDLRIRGGVIEQLRDDRSRQPLDLVRLEPPLVGSIYPAHHEDRVLVRRDQLPEALVQGLLAVEDRHFYQHHGVDPKAIARALWANLRAGRTVQGGSTLTQQLAKNFFLTPERSLWRKLNEALISLILEARYSKDEILEAYANEIYLGQDGPRAIHGFGLAAHFYFNRPLSELSLAENALLVGLVKGASYYDPRRHPERAKQRRDLVIGQMLAQGAITPAQAQKATAAPLGVTQRGKHNNASFPAFIDLVRRQLKRDYREEDLTSEGLRIFTTLDPWAQRKAERILASQLERLEKSRKLKPGTLNGALVMSRPQSGEVTAVVGGRAAAFAGFNRALDAVRPIGSLVKPAVYLTALGQPSRYTLVTPLRDEPITLTGEDGQVWKPENYDRTTHGEVPLHTALAQSYNLATVHLGMDLGLDAVIDTLQRLGVDRPMKPYPSLLLGALSLSPLEVTQVFQTYAGGGFHTPLRAISAVLDAENRPLQRYALEIERAADPAAVFLLNRNLVEVVREGTGRGLARYLPSGVEVAGKTGTTNDLRDSWFAGFGEDRLAVVWVGRDDNQPAGLTGSAGALPVWGRLMRELGVASFSSNPPDEVEYVLIDPETGLRADEGCPGAQAFPFIRGSEPADRAPCSRGVTGFLQRLFD